MCVCVCVFWRGQLEEGSVLLHFNVILRPVYRIGIVLNVA